MIDIVRHTITEEEFNEWFYEMTGHYPGEDDC